jgi:Protein of unknown function (DUF3619)
MNNYQENLHNQLGANIARRLDATTERLPYRVTQRLENGRKAAIAAMPAQSLVGAQAIQKTSSSQPSAVLLGGSSFGWLTKFLGFALPAAAIFCGVLLISNQSENLEADEQATIDAAMLTDDVPISAFTDRGFGVHIHNVQQ